MKRVITVIMLAQQPNTAWPNRKSIFFFTFVKELEITSTWRDLTDKGKVTLPKNVYVADANGKPVALLNNNVNLGGFGTNTPLFLKGDAITIRWGYAYFDSQGNEQAPMVNIFTGYINSVQSKSTFTLEVMDNMYILQQVKTPVKEWKGYTVEKILLEIIQGATMPSTGKPLPFTVNQLTQTQAGTIRTGGETVTKLLEDLRKTYCFEAYFRGSELRCGSFVYLPQDAGKPPYNTFTFQEDIISDNLEYARKDDMVLSCLATNTIESKTGETTKDGQPKTKKVKLSVLVTFKNGSDTPSYITPKDGEEIPQDQTGERHDFFFPGATTITALEKMATDQLNKFYYIGFRGKFTTFGMPYIKHGDAINLADNILPERNGTYMVRGVKYTAGTGGLRQEIELDYKVKVNSEGINVNAQT